MLNKIHGAQAEMEAAGSPFPASNSNMPGRFCCESPDMSSNQAFTSSLSPTKSLGPTARGPSVYGGSPPQNREEMQGYVIELEVTRRVGGPSLGGKC